LNGQEVLWEKAVSALLQKERLMLAARLLPGVVHNMSGAVQIISMPLELMEMSPKPLPPEDLAPRLESMRQGVDRMLTEMELLAARSNQDRDSQPALLDLADLAGQQLEFFKCDMFFKHQTLIDSQLPAGLGLVEAPYTDVALAFNALVTNALEAMAGQGKGSLRVSAKATGGRLRLLLSDSGPGPAPELVQTMFEPFTGDKPDHDGLGLFLARRALEPHGGEVSWLPGSPTTWELSLPAV
jgi:signal transduction histidine kinase